jgi:hypothetical protein
MLVPLFISLVAFNSQAASLDQSIIDQVRNDIVANIFHLTHDNHDTQIAMVSEHFSQDGMQALHNLLQDTGTDLLVAEHNMTVTSEPHGDILVEAVTDKSNTYRLFVPLLLTFNNAQAMITKPVVETFELVTHEDASGYHINHMTEILMGEVAMIDKGYRRARACPMFKPSPDDTTTPSAERS